MKEKTLLMAGSVSIALFLLLWSYTLVLGFFPLTAEQEHTLQFLEGKEELTLNYTAAEISHLDDVAQAMKSAQIGLFLSGIIILTLLFYFRRDKEQLLRLLKYGGISTVTFILLILVALLLNFNSLFTVFHQLFFPQGNWQFAADSVLIQTFPQDFFMNVSIFIFGLAFLLGSLFILLSFYLKHGHKDWGN